MALLTGSLLVDFALAFATVMYALYWYINQNSDYWEKRRVPYVNKGLLLELFLGRKSTFEAVEEMYNTFKGERYGGFFNVKTPMLMALDTDLINRILIKDFSYFQDRSEGSPTVDDPILSNLFSQTGHKLSPTFSAGKLKGMFDQLSKCGDNMVEHIDERTLDNREIECKEFLGEFTLDVISNVAFGLAFRRNSFEFNEFKSKVKLLTQKQSPFTFMKIALRAILPRLKLRTISKEFDDYFLNITKLNLQYRKENNVHRNDYFQLLMTLKEQEESGKDMMVADPTEDDIVVNQMQHADKENPLSISNTNLFTENAICANSLVFLIAGTEPTSSLVSLVLYNLTQHQQVQKQLQDEVDSVLRTQGGWSYQAVKDMTYLDQVVQETQRLHPSVAQLQRLCLKPYNIPGSDLVIEKGVLVSIPLYAIQRDPQYHPDPLCFKPERFKDNSFKPSSSYLPFGDGPRICIGMRFAIIEVKTCIARIISEYTVSLSPKTKIPLEMSRQAFIPTVEGGIWLFFKKRCIL